MLNKIRNYISSRRNQLIGSFIASIIVTSLLLFSGIELSIGYGSAYVPILGKFIWQFSYLLVPVLFSIVIMLSLYLLRLRNPVLSSGFGVAITGVLLTWLNLVVKVDLGLKYGLFLLIAFLVFYMSIKAFQVLKFKSIYSIIISVIIIVGSVYLGIIIERAAVRNEFESTQNKDYETAKKKINFKIYYPTYTSASLPATPPKLNDYKPQVPENDTTSHITFKLGNAKIVQTPLLKNQNGLMDFKRNCDILSLASTMRSKTEVKQIAVDKSLENLSRCKIVHTTPAGKDVYIRELGRGVLLYVQIEGTNITIEAEDHFKQKFDRTILPELYKLIDSFEPISTDKIERGRIIGSDYSGL